MALHPIVIPRQIQHIFLGKQMPNIPTDKDLALFRSDLGDCFDSKMEVIWNDNEFEIIRRDLLGCHSYVTCLRGQHQVVGSRFQIKARYHYGLSAKTMTIVSLGFIAVMSYINSEVIFGTLILYLFTHVEGVLILFMDKAFNLNRESTINDLLKNAASASSH